MIKETLLIVTCILYVATYPISFYLSGDLGWELTTIIKDIIISILFIIYLFSYEKDHLVILTTIVSIGAILAIFETIWNIVLFLAK